MQKVQKIDNQNQLSEAFDGSFYLPGTVGLYKIKGTDFVNVTIQSLMRVTPLRNFFLIYENYQYSKSLLVHRFGELTRRIWHARNCKTRVRLDEFLQAVIEASKKQLQIGAQSDPVQFMAWLLSTLDKDLKGLKNSSSIIHRCFQGELEVMKEIHLRPISGIENGKGTYIGEQDEIITKTSRMSFLMLGLDLPSEGVTPQVPIANILKKFDGESVTEVECPHVTRTRYRVVRLPQYLILNIRRFVKNNSTIEKNSTLVKFPIKNLELKDCTPLPTPEGKEKIHSTYDLIANVVHDGQPGEGSYRVFVHRKSNELW